MAVCNRICSIRADDATILRAKFTEIRKKLLLKEGKITPEYLIEVITVLVGQKLTLQMEELKRDYFFSLAIGHKMNATLQGKHVNLRVEELYEEAKEMSHTKWSEWIVMQIQFPDTL